MLMSYVLWRPTSAVFFAAFSLVAPPIFHVGHNSSQIGPCSLWLYTEERKPEACPGQLTTRLQISSVCCIQCSPISYTSTSVCRGVRENTALPIHLSAWRFLYGSGLVALLSKRLFRYFLVCEISVVARSDTPHSHKWHWSESELNVGSC